jgi:predicted metalloprotease
MKWREGRRSENVEDRRGASVGGRSLRVGGAGGLGILLIVVLALATGTDPGQLLEALSADGGPLSSEVETGQLPQKLPPGYDEASDFVAVVLADTEDTWGRIFGAAGRSYEAPRLVLFADAVRSACGTASAAVGPFYCPLDRKVYVDLAFFRDLDRRFGAPGDFAQAYVIAHEVGHHVQTLLGVSEQVRAAQSRASDEAESNALSVRMELQADCLAGVWGHHAKRRDLLEEGDVEEGLNAAAAIGDDRLQHQAQGQVNPESWTHGSSEQRADWLRRGLASGRIDDCETFGS